MRRSLVAGLVIAGLLAAVIAGWFQLRERGSPHELVLHGNVDIRQVSAAFEGSGRVLQMRAEEGDRVSAGQVLGRLDTTSLELQVQQLEARIEVQQQSNLRLRNGARPEEIAQARARLAAAQAESVRARDELARWQQVAGKTAGRGVSGRELDAAGSAAHATAARVEESREALRLLEIGARSEDVGAAEAQLRALRAELALLRHQIAQAELLAPVKGVVRSRLMEPGDLATPQKPAYTLALTEPKWVRVYVGEKDLGNVRPGLPVRVFTDSQPQQPIAGKVGYISSVAEFTPKSVQTEELRTSLVYELRAIVDDPNDVLRLGQPATVRIDLPTAQDAGR